MTTAREKFLEKTRRWVTAPSGWRYRVTGIMQAHGAAAMDAMFEIATPNLRSDEDETSFTPEQKEQIKTRYKAIASACVDAREFDGIMEEPPDPVDQWPVDDIRFVTQQAIQAAGMEGAAADEAGRVL